MEDQVKTVEVSTFRPGEVEISNSVNQIKQKQTAYELFNDFEAQTNGEKSLDSLARRPTDFSSTVSLSAIVASSPQDNVTEPSTTTKLRRYMRDWYKQKIEPYWKLAVAQLLCVIYILVLTFSYPPVGIRDPVTNNIIDPSSAENTANGVIYVNGDYRPVVAVGNWQKFCLAMSRMSAFSLYPMMVLVFLTKMKALQTFLVKTPFSIYFKCINEGHDFHAHAGRFIAFDVWIHTVFHLLRWGSQGNMSLLWTSAAGLSGLVTVVATPLITFPMMYWKKEISYEIRKGLHYLFYVFAVAMCFHTPVTAIPNGGFIGPVLGSCIVLYTLDALYVLLFMSENIETTSFHVLSSGVKISMPVSERFQKQAIRSGYAYINLPWIDDKQWHPFSLFFDPANPSIQQAFLLKNGDWTSDVHRALARDTTRPVWIQGPFPSPYSYASKYDNQILVASGIGITPALSTISTFKDHRRINLIWAVRDAQMLSFFLEHLYLHDGWNLIYYTGKKPLPPNLENTNTNVKIIKGRPELSSVIPNIIYGVESGEGLPERYTQTSRERMKELLVQRTFELEKDDTMKASEKINQLAGYVRGNGFSFTELVEEIRELTGDTHAGKIHVNEVNFNVEDNAEDVLDQLKASSNSIGFFDLEKCSTDDSSEDSFLADEIHDEKPSFRRRESSHRWTTMREECGRRESQALIKPSFKPWEKNGMQERTVQRLDENTIMSTWGIMYCGGSKPIMDSLQRISIDYKIDLHIDSFAW